MRFVSAEPLLGPLPSLNLDGISWLIVGGESNGPPERRLVQACGIDEGQRWMPKPEAVAWVDDLRLRARDAGTAFFLKQWGGPTPKAGGRLLRGRTWDEFPSHRAAVPA